MTDASQPQQQPAVQVFPPGYLNPVQVHTHYVGVFASAGFCFKNADGSLQMFGGSPIIDADSARTAILMDATTNIPESTATYKAVEGGFGNIAMRVFSGLKTTGWVDDEEERAHKDTITFVKRTLPCGANSALQRMLGEDGTDRVATRGIIIDANHNKVEGIILSTATGPRDPIAMQFTENAKVALKGVDKAVDWVAMAVGRQDALTQLGIDGLKMLGTRVQQRVDDFEAQQQALNAGNTSAGALGSGDTE